MSYLERTPSKVAVTPLDLSELQTGAIEYKNKKIASDPDEDKPRTCVEARTISPMGIVEIDGGVCVICQEGVSWDVRDGEDFTFEFYVSTADPAEPDRRFVGMFPEVGLCCSADEIRAMATGDPVPLHEWIRVFGDRLETNYRQQRRHLESVAV